MVRTYARLGEEVRFGDQLPLKLTIIDEQSVAFNMPDPVEDDTSVTTIIVHHSALAISLRIAFETLWAQASTFEDVLD